MINFPVPHTARYLNSGNVFEGEFNVPTVGVYDFNVSANVNQKIIDLQKNSVYLLERITVGGNISEEIFLNSIIGIPTIELKTLKTRQTKYEKPISILGFYKNQDVSTFIHTDIANDELVMSLNCSLNQVVETIGIAKIKIMISFSFFVIDNNEYNTVIRRGIDKAYSERLRT